MTTNFAMLSKPQKYFVDLPVPHVHQNEKILRYITILQNLKKDGFRPCKRCQPNGKPVDDTLWVEEIDTILQEQYAENLTLKELAYLAHGSESHLRHVFKKVTQKTPNVIKLSL